MLRNVVSLKQYTNNALYADNKFNCHGCKTDKAVEVERGVWHCNPCAFSICPDCIERTDALWEQQEQVEV